MQKLLIPLYPKIRLAFWRLIDPFIENKKEAEKYGGDAELMFYPLNSYKRYLLGKMVHEKESILKRPLPRFLWIIRHSYEGIPVLDRVYDATSVYPDNLLVVEYKIL